MWVIRTFKCAVVEKTMFFDSFEILNLTFLAKPFMFTEKIPFLKTAQKAVRIFQHLKHCLSDHIENACPVE